MKYRALLWDIDGTLLNFLAAERAAIKALFIEFGLGECTDRMLACYSEINKEYWRKLERNELSKQQILVMRFRDFFREYGLDEEKAEAFNARYQVALGDTIVFEPHAMEMLKKYQGVLVQCAVTNGTKTAQDKKLRESHMDVIFDHVFISEEVGAEKPNPEFFAPVLRALKDIPKEEMLIIGDSLTSDIRGGVNMGIDTCFYAPAGQSRDTCIPQPTYVIRDLEEIQEILK